MSKYIVSTILVFMVGCHTSSMKISDTTDTLKKDPMVVVAAQSLGPNDVFEVRVFNQPDLSQVYRVGPNGTISFPLIGEVQAAGKSPGRLAQNIQTLLDKDYIKNPQVSVFVKEYNSQKVSVFGQVSKPGTFPFTDGMNIIQAISMAGGFTNLASKTSVDVTRVVQGQEIRLTVKIDEIIKGRTKNFALRPGDIVYIPESIF